MKKAVATFVILAATAITGHASAGTIFGSSDCGKWINQKAEHRKAWLLGFLSGMNTIHLEWSPKSADPLDQLSSAEQVYLWMDNYCRANPLKTVDDGGYALYVELIQQLMATAKK